MREHRYALVVAAAAIAVLTTSGCTADPGQNLSPGPSESQATAPAPTPASMPTIREETPAPAPTATSSDQPVPKAGRPGAPAEPTVSAKPSKVDKPVSYPDGVKLTIAKVTFGEETDKGPGAFPGREFAVLHLTLRNESERALDLNSVVVTVLDKAGEPVQPVYASSADVADFTGTVAAGKSAKARYAFALAKGSRSKVTVVVDFDGVHTSAVFRGSL